MQTDQPPSQTYKPFAVTVSPSRGEPSRAVVLGGGGPVGVGWLIGMLLGLRDAGVNLDDADTVVGTSAGSIVGAHLRLDRTREALEAYAEDFVSSEPLSGMGRIGPREGLAFLRGVLSRDPQRGRQIIGAMAARAQTPSEESFISMITASLADAQWPERALLLTTVDIATGDAVVLHRDSGTDLQRAMAASSAVPGMFPPITIGGRRYMDGGVRSSANVDVAKGHDRILVLAPSTLSLTRRGNPRVQAKELGARVRSLVVAPDRDARRAIGRNPLDLKNARPAYEAGLLQAQRSLPRIRQVWSA